MEMSWQMQQKPYRTSARSDILRALTRRKVVFRLSDYDMHMIRISMDPMYPAPPAWLGASLQQAIQETYRSEMQMALDIDTFVGLLEHFGVCSDSITGGSPDPSARTRVNLLQLIGIEEARPD